MAYGNFAVFAGQSLTYHNPASSAPVPVTRSHVYMMKAGDRTWSPYSGVPVGGYLQFNAFLDTGPVLNNPANKFCDEWEARYNAGLLSEPLFCLLLGYDGASFSTSYNQADHSQWNLQRKRNNASKQWDGTFYSIPSDQGGGIYNFGPTTSAFEMLKQCIVAGKTAISGLGYQPRLLFVSWNQGQADATDTTAASEYYANETGLKAALETALSVPEIPWHTFKLAGQPLTRVGAATINAAKDQIGAENPLTCVIDPTTFPEYDAGDTSTYGGLYGSADGTHLTDLGCWRYAEATYLASIDNGKYGILL